MSNDRTREIHLHDNHDTDWNEFYEDLLGEMAIDNCLSWNDSFNY